MHVKFLARTLNRSPTSKKIWRFSGNSWTTQTLICLYKLIIMLIAVQQMGHVPGVRLSICISCKVHSLQPPHSLLIPYLTNSISCKFTCMLILGPFPLHAISNPFLANSIPCKFSAPLSETQLKILELKMCACAIKLMIVHRKRWNSSRISIRVFWQRVQYTSPPTSFSQ